LHGQGFCQVGGDVKEEVFHFARGVGIVAGLKLGWVFAIGEDPGGRPVAATKDEVGLFIGILPGDEGTHVTIEVIAVQDFACRFGIAEAWFVACGGGGKVDHKVTRFQLSWGSSTSAGTAT